MTMYEGGPVFCNKCGKEFTPAPEERSVKGEAEQFFNCPHCSHHYLIARISKKGLRLRARLQALSVSPVTGPIEERYAQIKSLREEFSREVTR